MLIIAFIGIALSQEVFWSNYSFQSPEYINLIAQQTNFARSFEEFGQILNFTIEYDSNQNKDQCSFEYQYLIFNQMYNVFGNLVNDLQLVEIDELETIQIEQGFQNQIVSYTKSDLTLLLLDRNGSIHYLNFDEGSLLFNYSKLNLTYYSQTKQHQQLLNDKETFYYVNNEQFSKFIIQNNQLYQFEILNWNQQYGTFKIQIRNNYVYLIDGQQLIIYKIVEHSLVLIKNLFAKDIYQENMKINLVDIFLQDEYIYILDHENGVKRVFLEDNKIDNDFYINQTGCQLISIFKDSAILVQQNQQRSIIYEGIINNKSWTLLQSKQISKKIIKNIKHLQHYALLLSNPINNIHRKYMIEQYTDKQILQGDDFYQMDFLGMENLDSNYLIGIFKYGIALYYTMEKPSTIVCSAQIPQINRIKIKLISTQCPNQNQTDLLNYCSSELEYVFEVRGALMNEFQERIFIYLCIGASIIVWLLVVSIIYIIRRYQMKKNQINEMKMKKIKPK